MREYAAIAYDEENVSLNPCCNGIYSMSVKCYYKENEKLVLILVVMEYTQ